MNCEEYKDRFDEITKHARQLGLDVGQCDKCRVPIIIGSQGDARNYLYPQPDIFADHLPEMGILCHDCYLHAVIEDQAARNGCGTCGEPVEDTKFQNENGFLCKKCVSEILG